MPHLLAIDDDPGRYDHLADLLTARGVSLSVACCSACVVRLLPTASAVLLDYDLDGGETCTCGAVPDRANGLGFVDAIAAARVPVVVVSASALANRKALAAALRENGATVTLLSASDPDPELRWLGWLWSLGVLDPDPKVKDMNL